MLKSHGVSRYFFIALVLLSAVALAAPAAAQPERVVLVSIDGLSAYSLEDDSLVIPNLRALIRDGVWAKSSETVFPSITHPSHTTLVTGVLPRIHGVVGNQVTNRETGESFHFTNKPHGDTVRSTTIFDAAKQKGLTTAAFYWPENYQDPSIDYNIPEVFDGDRADPRAADPEFLAELRAAGVPIDLYYEWYKDPLRKGASDAVLAEAAAYVIERYRPHLLAIHFLVTDEIQHAYGSDHYRAKEAFTAADYALGLVMRAVEKAGLRDQTAFFIVSDHGFHSVRHEVNLQPLFDRHGLAERVRLKRSGWTLYIELADLERDEAALEKLFEDALAMPGIARILRPRDFHDLGYPRYEEDPHVLGQYAIVGDIDTLPVADPKTSSTERRSREPYHGHGYLPSHPRMYPAFIASGPGIARGVRAPHLRNVDVAPTIAHLLGLELPDATGVVIKEVLRESEAEDVATAYLRAIQDQDWDAMKSFLDADSHYQDFTMEYFDRDAIDLRGPEAIVGFWESSSEQSGTSEIRYVVEKKMVAGPAILLDLALHVRVSGSFWNVDQPEVVLDSRVVTFLRIEDGIVTHHIDFADYADAMEKIDALR